MTADSDDLKPKKRDALGGNISKSGKIASGDDDNNKDKDKKMNATASAGKESTKKSNRKKSSAKNTEEKEKEKNNETKISVSSSEEGASVNSSSGAPSAPTATICDIPPEKKNDSAKESEQQEGDQTDNSMSSTDVELDASPPPKQPLPSPKSVRSILFLMANTKDNTEAVPKGDSEIPVTPIDESKEEDKSVSCSPTSLQSLVKSNDHFLKNFLLLSAPSPSEAAAELQSAETLEKNKLRDAGPPEKAEEGTEIIVTPDDGIVVGNGQNGTDSNSETPEMCPISISDTPHVTNTARATASLHFTATGAYENLLSFLPKPPSDDTIPDLLPPCSTDTCATSAFFKACAKRHVRNDTPANVSPPAPDVTKTTPSESTTQQQPNKHKSILPSSTAIATAIANNMKDVPKLIKTRSKARSAKSNPKQHNKKSASTPGESTSANDKEDTDDETVEGHEYSIQISREMLGLTVENVLERTIVRTVLPGGAAKKAGAKVGSLIIKVGSVETHNLTHFETIDELRQSQRPLRLVLRRIGKRALSGAREEMGRLIRGG
eukprot:CAMPEP_0172502818 /NCGR_PEP_ID=MMETSP1066-20121228/163006_1 /TAXON_ID=671091 /ORGANISM="Coscinodiscus wailesii, Strain CCMP2513" /LENGTH=549 /DNA_ID=CAMNT_0013278211 /DNA_START=197 /DNA_END=1843 /DNA_ORIENTATION=-